MSVLLLGPIALAAPQTLGNATPPLHRQSVLIPVPHSQTMLRALVYRPAGPGPYPVAVINHGSSSNEEVRAAYPAPSFEPAAMWFVRHGYVAVAPQRSGHGQTGGPYLEDYGDCDDPHYTEAALGAAVSIDAAIKYLTAQPFIRKDTGSAVLIGHSAGAWGALALASRNPSPVGSVVVFGGGLGGRSYDLPDRNCAPDRLVKSAQHFGLTARAPTLWIYAANDTYFGPRLSKQLADAFAAAGGRADYHLLPSFGTEGHYLLQSPESVPLWGPILEKFLAHLSAPIR